MTKEAEMKNERIYKEGEKFKLAFCVNEIQEYVSPYNFATFEGEILGGSQDELENTENITTLKSTEVFRGVLPLDEIESLEDVVFEAYVEVCFDQDYEIYFLYIIEIQSYEMEWMRDESDYLNCVMDNPHPLYEVKIQILEDGVQIFEKEGYGLIGKILEQKEISGDWGPILDEEYYVLTRPNKKEPPAVGSVLEAIVMMDRTDITYNEEDGYSCYSYYAIHDYKLIE